MYFNFENYESKGGSKEHFLNSFTKNYDLENDTYERVQKGIENFNKENNTSFDLYDYLKFNSKKIKFKKKDPLQEQGKEDLNEDLAEQKEPLQDENLEENKSFKRKHDLSKESEILNDTSLLSDVKNSLKRGAETLSDVVGLDELVNFDSDIKSKADENIKDLIKQGASYEDLNELEKNYLANKESRENVRDATNIFSKEKSIKGLATLYGTNEEEKAKKAFAEMKSTQEALSKEKFEDLNEQEKELIDKERGAVESFFVNLRDDEYKQKSFDELKEKYEAKNFISKDVLRDLEFLKNIHQSKSVSSLILSADEKEKKDYENSVLNIALNAGFDDVLVDEKEGKMYFEKEGQKYLVNEGFFDNFTNTLLANTGSITGGLIGAAKGASSAKSPQSALAKSIAYSALGSGIGASADVLATNYLLDRKNRFDEMLHHALEESALSAVGDALVLGAKPLLKTAKDSIKDFGKILDYTPLVSTTKNFPTQNIKAAQDLVEKSVDLNTQKELDEFYKTYGGRSNLSDSKALDGLVSTFKAKFGENSTLTKQTQKLNEILNLNSLSHKQNALFEAIRADESGFLLPYIKEVASYDVRAFKNLKNILNLSTQRLESSLKNMNLNKGDIKNILDELESGTKDSYNEAMNEILAKTYDDRFKVVLGGGEAEELLPIIKETQLKDLTKKNTKLKTGLFTNNKIAEILGLDTSKDIFQSIQGDKIIHTLNRHGTDTNLVKKSGQEATTYEDIGNSHNIVNKADLYAIKQVDDVKILLSAKQINGHHIIVESVSTKNNELKFKSYYKEKGKITDNKDFMSSPKILTPQGEAITPLSQKPSVFLDSTSAQNNYTTFRKNLQEQGLLDEEAMKFLNYVENTIYNPKGVTFTQLNNALKNINSFYKQSTNPGFKEHIKNAVESFLREDIKKGINEIFKQDKNLYAKASKLYETSLAEYAQMKELLKASAYKKARNESTTQVKALDELIKYSKGQGKDGLNNLDFLRAKLDDKNVAVLEMNLLNRLYEKSLANTDESLRVFDSTSFLNELSTLQNNAFKSKEANEFIELVKGFDKLFKNDAKIALELAPVTAKKEGSALATSAKGAVLQKVVKSGFDLVFRNLGQNVLFGAFKDSIQGAALRYHLKKALQKSDTISEFNTSLKDRLKKGQFNSKTKELSKDFLNDVENFSKNLDEEVLKNTKANDESLKDLPKEQSIEFNTGESKSLTELRKDIMAKLKGIKNQDIRNKNTNITAQISSTGINKISSKVAINKSIANGYTKEEHFAAGERIKELFENATLKSINEDKNKSKDIKAIYRFNTEFVINGKDTNALITVKENIVNGNKIYSLELEELSPVSFTQAHTKQEQYGQSNLTKEVADAEVKDFTTPIEKTDKPNSIKNPASLSKTRELEDIKFSDTKGKEHTLTKETQEQWLKTFELENLEQSYIPKHSEEIKEALGKEIRLTKGSLLKLVSKEREQYIPQIKETLDNPDFVLKDVDNMIILAKKIDDKQYFTSINLETDDFLISVSNAPKKENILKNKVEKGAKIIYQSPNSESIFYTPELLQASQSLANKIDKDNSTTNLSKEQIPQEQYKQTLKEIEEQEQYYHKLDYKPSIKPILDNLQKEFKNNDYAILNWKERNSVGKMVVKKANFISYEDIKNTLQAYENYAKAGNNATKEIEAIQKALKDIEAQYTKKEQVRQEAQQVLDELKEQKRALRLRYYKADIFTQYPHQILAIQSKENQRSEIELLKHIKESNYLESITQAKEVVEQIRKDIQRDFNITPIAEFGTNYAEHYRDGANAIAKVLREKQGQVAGAFYKEGLGDIDLVWGDSTFGLAHILERRTQDFIKEGLSEAEAKTKAREFVESIPEIVENGKIRKEKTRAFIEFNDKQSVIALDYKGDDSRKWLLTAYKNYDDAPSPAYSHQDRHNINTSSETRIDGDIKKGESIKTARADTLTKEADNLSLNSKDDSSTDLLILNKQISKNDISIPSSVSKSLSAFTNRFLNDASLATRKKFEALKLDKFMSDFDNVRGVQSLGIIENTPTHTINGYVAHLQNGYKIHIKTYEPRAKGEEVRGFKKTYFYKDYKVKLILSDEYNKPQKSLDLSIQEITPHGFNQKTTMEYSITLNDGLKAKTLQTNTANTGRQTSNLSTHKQDISSNDILDTKLLGNDGKYKEAKEYELLHKEGYKGFKIDIKQSIKEINPYKIEHYFNYTATKDKQIFSARTLQELKEIIDYSQKEISKEESNALSNFVKDLNIKVFGKIKQSKLTSYGHLSDSNYQAEPIKTSRDFLDDLSKLHKFGDYAYDKLKNIYDFDKLNSKYLFDYQEELHNINKLVKEQGNNFGINFIIKNHSENLTKGEIALDILLNARVGQVKNAFHKEGLGDIDLVWGKITDAKNHKGYGLAHILDKHPDFDVYKIPEIIEKGEVINQNNIRYRIQQDDYVIGLSAEYKGEKRNFIITAFERSKDKGDTFTERPFTQTSDNAVKNLDKPNSTTNSIKLQANSHIGTGLASGSLAGLETDENGNVIGFNPQKFALGFLGGSATSLAVSKGFKVLKEKPELKEAIKKELADTLAQGFENASKKYPMLDMLKPIKLNIMQSEKGRIAQAGYLIKRMEKESLEQSKEEIIKNLDNLNAENLPKELSKEEFLNKGLSEVVNKENFVKHLSNSQDSFMRLKYLNLVEPTKQRANIEFTQGERKGYIKAFKDENKHLFYVLITEDKDKILITGIPTSKKREVIRQIKKADFITRRMDSIDTLSPTAKATAKAENVSTSQPNSSTNSKLLSKAQSKFKYDEKKGK